MAERSCSPGSAEKPSARAVDATAPCCGAHPARPHWQVGETLTVAGMIPVVSTELRAVDRLGALKVRWNIGRMSYAIQPGLYAVGDPGADSPVLVTANYKLTFDSLRRELVGLSAWILVLDTKGVNVWCAAGKGTFGTDELVRRIAAVRLAEVVRHRTLVLPQLGASGVAAPAIRERAGFGVVYGPVYARDIRAFLAAGMMATPAMRRVQFDLMDRLTVIPVELTAWLPYWALLTALLCLGAGLLGADWRHSGGITLLTGLAFLAGGAVVPTFLPWIPGRAFAVKGAIVGFLLAFAVAVSGAATGVCGVRSALELAAWWLLLPVIASFLALNFTGATTFTSQSGVKYEMKLAMPVLAVGLIAGLVLFAAAQVGGSHKPSGAIPETVVVRGMASSHPPETLWRVSAGHVRCELRSWLAAYACSSWQPAVRQPASQLRQETGPSAPLRRGSGRGQNATSPSDCMKQSPQPCRAFSLCVI